MSRTGGFNPARGPSAAYAHKLKSDEEKDQLVGRRHQHRAGVDHEESTEEFAGSVVGRFLMRQSENDQAGYDQ
ncbi:MAG: hypothetical protein ACLQIB_41010 [Isosphaeraceae bacterium]